MAEAAGLVEYATPDLAHLKGADYEFGMTVPLHRLCCILCGTHHTYCDACVRISDLNQMLFLLSPRTCGYTHMHVHANIARSFVCVHQIEFIALCHSLTHMPVMHMCSKLSTHNHVTVCGDGKSMSLSRIRFSC